MSTAEPQPTPPPGPSRGPVRRFLVGLGRARESWTLLLIVIVVVIFHVKTLPTAPGAPTPSVFLSPDNLKAMLVSISTEAVLVVGMTVVIVAGGFDISVGSVLAVSGLATCVAFKAGAPLPVGILAGLVCGALCGLINGLLISRVGVSPLIATLGMLMAARGLVIVYVHELGAIRSDDLPRSFLSLGQAKVHDISGFWVIFVMLAVVLIGDILLRNLRWLRQAYYLGGNERAAALSGINVRHVRTVAFVLCGVTAAIAGVLNSARFGGATYEAGQGVELTVIAECVIGGASLVGGQGTVLGAFLGVVLVNCIKIGLTQLGMPPDWQYVIVGVALVVFVSIDIVLAKRRQG